MSNSTGHREKRRIRAKAEQRQNRMARDANRQRHFVQTRTVRMVTAEAKNG